jgi:DNA invertase Pin-like site-specific DNA recombinase
MKTGYGRVSTRDQNPDPQRDALAGAGCGQAFIDKAFGKLASRPELVKALMVAREGDQLVVTKLDRHAGGGRCDSGGISVFSERAKLRGLEEVSDR